MYETIFWYRVSRYIDKNSRNAYPEFDAQDYFTIVDYLLLHKGSHLRQGDVASVSERRNHQTRGVPKVLVIVFELRITNVDKTIGIFFVPPTGKFNES